jgi:hypothetical protein
MKKRWLTMAVCVLLLCAACGQKDGESTLSAEPVTSVVTTEAAATPQPDTLEGRLRTAILEEIPNLDLTLTLGVTQDDTNSIRTATLRRRATGANVAWAVDLPDSQVWFSGDTAYITGDNGSFQGPISLENFQAAVPSLPQLLSDLPDWTAEETAEGYSIEFSSQDTGFWDYFQPVVSRMAPELTLLACNSLELSGTAQLDADGAVQAQSVKLTLDLDGQAVELLAELSAAPTEVLPELLDVDYLEVPDPTLPGAVVTAYGIAAQDGTQVFQNLVHLTVTQDGDETLYKQQDVISTSQSDKGLSCAWTTSYGEGEDILRTVEDKYTQGLGTLTEDDDVICYSYDDDSMWGDISSFITAYEDALAAATDITVSQEDDLQAIVLTLPEDYALPILTGYLRQMTDLDPDDGEDFQASGTLTIWVTAEGALHGQSLALDGSLTLDDEDVELELYDWGLAG